MKKILKCFLIMSVSFEIFSSTGKLSIKANETPELDEPIEVENTTEVTENIQEAKSARASMPVAKGDVAEVKFINGIWQLRSNFYAPTGFTWGDNGIPLSVIYFTDSNGNKLANQTWNGTQKYFKFYPTMSYATGSHGWNSGWHWFQYASSGYGSWWMALEQN